MSSNIELMLNREIGRQIGELGKRLDASVDSKLAETQSAITGIVNGQLSDFTAQIGLSLASIDKSNNEMFMSLSLDLKSSLVEIVNSQQQQQQQALFHQEIPFNSTSSQHSMSSLSQHSSGSAVPKHQQSTEVYVHPYDADAYSAFSNADHARNFDKNLAAQKLFLETQIDNTPVNIDLSVEKPLSYAFVKQIRLRIMFADDLCSC